MHKSLLVSSILLAAAGCSAESSDLQQMQSDAVTSRASLVEKVFVSNDTFGYTTYDWVAGESVERHVAVKLRLKFIPAEDYTLNEQAGGMDYEVIVERFVAATGETFSTDTTYFVRKTGAIKHELFDCDSTRRCSTDTETTSLYVYDTPQGEGMRLKNEHVSLIQTPKSDIEFHAL